MSFTLLFTIAASGGLDASEQLAVEEEVQKLMAVKGSLDEEIRMVSVEADEMQAQVCVCARVCVCLSVWGARGSEKADEMQAPLCMWVYVCVCVFRRGRETQAEKADETAGGWSGGHAARSGDDERHTWERC